MISLSRTVRVVLACTAGALVVFLIALSVFAVRLQPWAKQQLIESLSKRYRADVKVGDVQIRLLPWPSVSGSDISIVPRGGAEMIHIAGFTASSNLIGMLRSPKHLSRAAVTGLRVKIPARKSDLGGHNAQKEQISVVVDEVSASDVVIETTPGDSSKEPIRILIHTLAMHRVGKEDAMSFHAELTNPKPFGFAGADGSFGPWNSEEPSDTPIEAKYRLSAADLSVFNGIEGHVSSDGSLRGTLDEMNAQGAADVPDFALKGIGHGVPLHVDYAVTVDGTNGNTILRPARAKLGESIFVVKGAIDRGMLERRKTVLLETQSESARLYDLLRLAMRGSGVPMSGAAVFQSLIEIPPGETEMLDRLHLKGSYELKDVKFTSPQTEQRITSLSHRAEGDPKNTSGQALSQFRGDFELRGGTMNLPDIEFAIPGARVSLAGSYQLRGGAMDFSGTAKMDATVSEMTTGVKRVLLKPIDPLFKRSDAGAVVPIRISGTPGQPSFSFDVGRAIRKK